MFIDIVLPVECSPNCRYTLLKWWTGNAFQPKRCGLSYVFVTFVRSTIYTVVLKSETRRHKSQTICDSSQFPQRALVLNIKFLGAHQRKLPAKRNARSHINTCMYYCRVFYMVWRDDNDDDENNNRATWPIWPLRMCICSCVCLCLCLCMRAHTFSHHTIAHKKHRCRAKHTRGDTHALSEFYNYFFD